MSVLSSKNHFQHIKGSGYFIMAKLRRTYFGDFVLFFLLCNFVISNIHFYIGSWKRKKSGTV